MDIGSQRGASTRRAARYSGVAVSRELAAIVFGGSALFIAVSLSTLAGGSWPVALYVVLLATTTFVAC